MTRRRAVLAALAGATLAGTGLAGALVGCTGGVRGRRGTPPADPIGIATGSTSGVYYSYGAALAATASPELGPVHPVPTTGSLDNITRLAAGTVNLAFSAHDAATAAFIGEGSSPGLSNLRALALLYDDQIHLVVAGGSSVYSVSGLAGLRVSVGAVGSGTALIARRVLAAEGVDPGTGIRRRDLGLDESVQAMLAGELDALFWSGGLPTSAITELSQRMTVRLLDLSSAATRLRASFGASYRKGVIPRATYPGQADSVATVAVPNLLLTMKGTDASLARRVTTALFAQAPRIGATVPVANQLDEHAAIFTQPVPLHAGALDYYRAHLVD